MTENPYKSLRNDLDSGSTLWISGHRRRRWRGPAARRRAGGAGSRPLRRAGAAPLGRRAMRLEFSAPLSHRAPVPHPTQKKWCRTADIFTRIVETARCAHGVAHAARARARRAVGGDGGRRAAWLRGGVIRGRGLDVQHSTAPSRVSLRDPRSARGVPNALRMRIANALEFRECTRIPRMHSNASALRVRDRARSPCSRRDRTARDPIHYLCNQPVPLHWRPRGAHTLY